MLLQLLQNLGMRDRDPAALLGSVTWLSKGKKCPCFNVWLQKAGLEGLAKRCVGPGFRTSVMETPKTSWTVNCETSGTVFSLAPWFSLHHKIIESQKDLGGKDLKAHLITPRAMGRDIFPYSPVPGCSKPCPRYLIAAIETLILWFPLCSGLSRFEELLLHLLPFSCRTFWKIQ